MRNVARGVAGALREASVRSKQTRTALSRLSGSRILSFDGQTVTFSWRDDAGDNAQKPMALDAVKFLRRFLQHVVRGRDARAAAAETAAVRCTSVGGASAFCLGAIVMDARASRI